MGSKMTNTSFMPSTFLLLNEFQHLTLKTDVLFPEDVKVKKRTFKGVIKKSILVDSMISEMRKTIKFQELPGKQEYIEDLNTGHMNTRSMHHTTLSI